jgi:hypothetical protein
MIAFGRRLVGLIAVVLLLAACGSTESTTSATSRNARPATPMAAVPTTENSPCQSPVSHPANWPAGGAVPPELSGSWIDVRNPSYLVDLHCNDFNFSRVIYGNVVVRGSKLDFIQESVGDDPNGGFVCDSPSGDKPVLVIEYDWILTQGLLQITRTSPNLCHWGFTGTTIFKRSGA